MAAAAAAEAVEAAVEATVVAMGVAVRRPEAVYIRIKSIVKASISLSSTRKGYGSGVWIKGMDQSMDRGVWIVCSFGALIHTLYFDSYPYSFLVGSGSDVCVNSPSLPGVGGRGRSPLIYIPQQFQQFLKLSVPQRTSPRGKGHGDGAANSLIQLIHQVHQGTSDHMSSRPCDDAGKTCPSYMPKTTEEFLGQNNRR